MYKISSRVFVARVHILFVYTLTFISAGCVYSPESEYINPIPPPAPIQVTLDVSDPDFRPRAYLLFPTQYFFTISETEKPIVGYEVTMNGQTISSYLTENRLSFSLFPTHYSDGTYEIVIKVILATQSGSLAEQLGAEHYVVDRKFIVIVDRRLPPTVSLNAAYENGYLTLRWDRLERENFVYVLKGVYEPYNPVLDTLMYDISKNFFIDPHYVGGTKRYTLMAFGVNFEREIGTVTFSDPPVKVKATISSDGFVKVAWSENKLILDNTYIKINSRSEKILPLSNNGEVTMDSLLLGDDIYVQFEIFRHNIRVPYQYTERIADLPNLKAFNIIAMLPLHNKLLVASNDKIYRYSLPEFHLEDSILSYSFNSEDISSMVVNSNGTTGLFTAGGALIKFNPVSFENLNPVDIYNPTITATSGSAAITSMRLGGLSNDGLLALDILKNGNSVPVVFDIDALAVRWSSYYAHGNLPADPPKISNDGSYLALDNHTPLSGEIFKRTGTTFTSIGRTDVGHKFFRNTSNELVTTTILNGYINQNITVRAYNLDTPPGIPDQAFTPARTLELAILNGDEYLETLSYDPTTESIITMYGVGYPTIKLININDFSLLKTMKVRAFGNQEYLYSNNYQLLKRGFIEAVK